MGCGALLIRRGERGGFWKSCKGCHLEGTKLVCDCATPKGAPGVKAAVDLSMLLFSFFASLPAQEIVTGY